jgi:hypothetical protein
MTEPTNVIQWMLRSGVPDEQIIQKIVLLSGVQHDTAMQFLAVERGLIAQLDEEGVEAA